MAEYGTMRVKSGLAEMLKGGVIMDVTDRRAGADRRGRRRVRRHGAGARPGGHPRAGRRGPHVRPRHDQRDPGGRDDPRDGQGAHRPLRRGAGAAGARGRLHRRVRGADAGRRGAPHRQVEVRRAVRLRRDEPRRGAAAHRRGRGDDPLQGRGRHRQRDRGRRATCASITGEIRKLAGLRSRRAVHARQGAAVARVPLVQWVAENGTPARRAASPPAASRPRPTPR